MMKTCSRCKETSNNFCKNAASPDGLYSLCKNCRRVISKIWRLENAERESAASAARYQKTKKRLGELRKARYEANKAVELARNAAWYARQGEDVKKYYKDWHKRNPVKARALVARRRAKKNAAEGIYTDTDVKALFDAQHGLCNHCSKDISKRFEVDHIVPIFRGGSNWPNNLQLLCMPCNRSKSYKTPEEWRIKQLNQVNG